MNDDPTAANDDTQRTLMFELRQAHEDLDAAVAALLALPSPDQLRIARLKKQKLLLRDRIADLEDRMTPDIIA